MKTEGYYDCTPLWRFVDGHLFDQQGAVSWWQVQVLIWLLELTMFVMSSIFSNVFYFHLLFESQFIHVNISGVCSIGAMCAPHA